MFIVAELDLVGGDWSLEEFLRKLQLKLRQVGINSLTKSHPNYYCWIINHPQNLVA